MSSNARWWWRGWHICPTRNRVRSHPAGRAWRCHRSRRSSCKHLEQNGKDRTHFFFLFSLLARLALSLNKNKYNYTCVNHTRSLPKPPSHRLCGAYFAWNSVPCSCSRRPASVCAAVSVKPRAGNNNNTGTARSTARTSPEVPLF